MYQLYPTYTHPSLLTISKLTGRQNVNSLLKIEGGVCCGRIVIRNLRFSDTIGSWLTNVKSKSRLHLGFTLEHTRLRTERRRIVRQSRRLDWNQTNRHWRVGSRTYN